MVKDKKTLIGFGVLVFFASIKVVADVFGWTNISSLSAATNLSPAMKVFTAHKGYETYSSDYSIEVNHIDGESKTVNLDSNTYKNISGPYNRRNVFGASIAYGPLLVSNENTKPMWESIVQSSFCEQGSKIFSELGFDASKEVSSIEAKYIGVRDAKGYPQEIKYNCK